MLMIIIVFFRKHESNSWIFLFILKKDSSNSMCTMANDVVSTTWLDQCVPVRTGDPVLVMTLCYWVCRLIIHARGLSCSFLNMPLNSMPIMCLSVCEPAKFELQEIKRGEYFHVSMVTQGLSWRLLWLNKKGVCGKSTELKDFVHLIKAERN
jgi:hypothetical protein